MLNPSLFTTIHRLSYTQNFYFRITRDADTRNSVYRIAYVSMYPFDIIEKVNSKLLGKTGNTVCFSSLLSIKSLILSTFLKVLIYLPCESIFSRSSLRPLAEAHRRKIPCVCGPFWNKTLSMASRIGGKVLFGQSLESGTPKKRLFTFRNSFRGVLEKISNYPKVYQETFYVNSRTKFKYQIFYWK